MEPELEKLRRFCMTVALILITYVLAGVKVDISKSISVMGLPLMMSRPELIPAGLVIASVYNTIRFWYYALIAKRSPRKRRHLFLIHFERQTAGKYLTRKVISQETLNSFRERLGTTFPEFP